MLFASAIFLYYFLPAFLLIYYVAGRRARSWILSLASYVFYGWWRPDFLILMFASTVVDWSAARGICKDRERHGTGRRWLYLSLVSNLSLLAYFKYANFGIESLNHVLRALDMTPVSWTRVVLPVGISFYTFQTLSYTIDVYRGHAAPARSFGDILCFVSMFPQLVAGPIVRYNTVAEQLRSRTHSLDKLYRGILCFQAGLAKKLLIADVLGSVADAGFGSAAPTTADAWAGALAYTFQIYFDFSGYSDMAIGLGLMLGFAFPVNFDQPYRSLSITEFWRRWHISLSSFLRDYLYIPLGGNRKGTLRTYVNLSLTMLLGGLWHGAAWTFVLWGAYQGFWLVVERLNGGRSFYAGLPRALQNLCCMLFVVLGWVVFRADSLREAGTLYSSLLGFAPEGASSIPLLLRPIHWTAFAAGSAIVWLAPTTQVLVRRLHPAWVASLQIAFLLSLCHLHYLDHVPFLYFQF